MPRFAANLSFLFAEHPFLDRFQLAKEAGFQAVEFLFPYAYPVEEIQARLRATGLRIVLHNLPAGDWDAGDRGMACDPTRIAEFRASVQQGIAYAKALGVPQLHVLAGKVPAGMDAATLRRTYVDNLRFAAEAFAKAGLQLLIEPLNPGDVAGYYLNRSAQAIEILDELNVPNAWLQYDLYHAQRTEGELAATLQRLLPRIGHVQIADNPGRHEPGTGEIHYPYLLAQLDRLGYQGWVGCEYQPATTTEAGLGWLRQISATPATGHAVAANHAADPRALLRALFDAAIASAQPERVIAPHVPAPHELPNGRLVVIGAGKASAAMAQAVEHHWRGDPQALSGLVVTRYGYGAPCQRIEIVEAAHPVPDAAGEAAARRLLALAHSLTAEDTVLCLISGGGSALLPLPLPGLSLADKQAINRALLRSGATITEMNTLRRHLSAIKGGRLAAACHPARLRTLLISDVPGDDPIDIASGPTVADPTTCADARDIVQRYGIGLPPAAHALLAGDAGESVKPGDPRLAGVDTRIVAAPLMALQAAAEVARAAGVTPVILGDALEGEARDVGTVLAGMARHAAGGGLGVPLPCVLLSGGETTVTVRGQGRGGRNVECALALALGLRGQAGVWALAGDTDGVDGQEEIAGALVTPDTLARAWAAGMNPAQRLADNDGHGFFQALGDSVVTGPTRTNVNDFRAILVMPGSGRPGAR
jgi:hydroxypyruvate reductase